jgi:SAM-dependent methyltransferase
VTELEIHVPMPTYGLPNPFDPESTRIELDEHISRIQLRHPEVAHLLADLDEIDPFVLPAKLKALQACFEFSEKGRGIQWAVTIEQHLRVRRCGASMLLASLNHRGTNSSDSRGPYCLLDVFGGAGFIAQFAREIYGFKGTVLTSDPSPVMVQRSLEKGLPAFWQRAQDLFMTRSNSVDAVLFAYGTHHVPIHERAQSFQEAWRVLKPGGVLVFHDFEENTPTARWFREVVDRYTVTGHKHPHFTVGGLSDYYTGAGFKVERISIIDDCFQFGGSSVASSRKAAIEFMGGAYGLEKLDDSEAAAQFLWQKITRIFSVQDVVLGASSGGGVETIIHRPALLGVGRKPKRT